MRKLIYNQPSQERDLLLLYREDFLSELKHAHETHLDLRWSRAVAPAEFEPTVGFGLSSEDYHRRQLEVAFVDFIWKHNLEIKCLTS